MEVKRRLMVVGARSGNLGMKVLEEAARSHMFATIQGYDIQGGPPAAAIRYFDIGSRRQIIDAIERECPTDIVCTVGVNSPEGQLGELRDSMSIHFKVNCWGPMLLLQEALDLWLERWRPGQVPETGFNFCAVSSNSAQIARSQSAGYCASKAALSMALRCVARRVAGDMDTKIWGYEPGFLSDTPMSKRTAEQFPEVPLHRIPSGEGIPAGELADRIVADVINAQLSMNGCMFRIDGGEQ